ncbi:hypothetical protein EZV62_009826 [Acer yangbiense]|uniref:Uncharacterized protein n=1 Tax=Acer yangbiense TaxID=1000413 RepID=A0A5C7I316_9ROSI|nr:hypothetical protein EZV62_009826 [Acer yangbiense]
MPLTMGAVVEDNGGRLTVKMRNIGSTPYAVFNMGLIQANDQHINFFHQERTYDVRVGMLSAKFRDIVMDMVRRSVDTVSVIITSTQIVFGQILRPDLNECIIEGDTGNDPIQFLLSVAHLVLIAKGQSTFLPDMVWINGSYTALPMLNCHVPSIGELSYYFV